MNIIQLKIRWFLFSLLLCTTLIRASEPNDPNFSQQWALKEGSIGWLIGKQLIDQHFTSGAIPRQDSPVAAIIDISFKYHEDLPKLTHLYNGTNYIVRHHRASGRYWVEANTKDENTDGHGNGSLGVMAAATDNQLGIAGTGFGKIKILAIDAHYVDENGQHISGMETENLIKAIDFVIEQKKKANVVAVNMSFVSPADDLTQAINRLKEHDIIVVAAAGNHGQDIAQTPYFPAAASPENIISVAELGQNMSLTPSSNFGGNISIAAPGEGMPSFGINNDYIPAGGSSAAAPFVTGTLVAGVALYNQKKKQGFEYDDITAAQLINLLYQTANASPALAGKVEHARYINVGKFMQGILACQEEAIKLKGSCSLPKTFPKRANLPPVKSAQSQETTLKSPRLSILAEAISAYRPYLLGVLVLCILILIYRQKRKR